MLTQRPAALVIDSSIFSVAFMVYFWVGKLMGGGFVGGISLTFCEVSGGDGGGGGVPTEGCEVLDYGAAAGSFQG